MCEREVVGDFVVHIDPVCLFSLPYGEGLDGAEALAGLDLGNHSGYLPKTRGRSRRRVASGKNKDDDKHTEHGTEHPLRLALTGQSFLLRAFSGNVWPTEPFDDAERGVAAR